ncbi:antitoxin MazE-like protein [Georgenia muralis]
MSRERVKAHVRRLREQGLRPLQIWVPDVNAPQFAEEARRRSAVAARSDTEQDDQTFVDAVSWEIADE